MIYLSQLTEEEIRYICEAIPAKDTIAYFKHYPKEFSKVLPGFRANAIGKLNIGNLLFNHHNHDFISSFLEKHVNDWLTQIKEHLDNCIKDGNNKEEAIFNTLPFSYFADNIELYYKLTDEECSEEYISIMSAALSIIKESDRKLEESREELKTKVADSKNLITKYVSAKSGLEKAKGKINELSSEIKLLKRSISDLEKLKTIIKNDEKIIEYFKAEIHEQEGLIHKQKIELVEVRDSSKRLEEQIRAELAKQQAAEILEQLPLPKPICPKDIEEFKDYLGYNLENLGVPENAKYYSILKDHLCTILFNGVPIVVNRKVGAPLIMCVANALIGQSNVKTLTYSKEYKTEDINKFLSSGERIVCLDNFIGKFDETELIPLFDSHRDKIIFLTVAFDRTIHYVSKEFFLYSQYLNFNRIAAFSANIELKEDPSIFEEVETEIPITFTDNRYSIHLRRMLSEFGYPQSLIEYKSAVVSDEQDLCRALAFDVLPYCMDVLQIAPYNSSERLLKYAGDSGRCPYKDLFKEWFT